jgi:hypothetical protein
VRAQEEDAVAAATATCKLQLSALQAKFDENADHKDKLEAHTHKLQASCEEYQRLAEQFRMV